MLNWFVNNETVTKVLKTNHVIQEDEVETISDNISSAVLDKQMKINLMKKYFTADAWKIVEQVYETKKKLNEWECPSCKENLDTTVDDEEKVQTSIGCDYCCEWYHLKCTGLKHCPHKTYWMCKKCEKISMF